jgi:hypothetical protein
VSGDGALGVHCYKNIVPLMEPSNWSRVYGGVQQPKKQGYFSPLYKEQLFAGVSFNTIFIRFRVLKYKQFFKCLNKVLTFNTKQNLCISKDNK